MSNPALQREGILAQIPPCPAEGNLNNIQKKVKGALDWLLERKKSAKNINELMEYDVMIDSVAHVCENMSGLGPMFFEIFKEISRSAFGNNKPENTITALLQTFRIRNKKYSYLLNRMFAAIYEFAGMFNIFLIYAILQEVIIGLYHREIISFGNEGIMLEPLANNDRLIEIATHGCFDIKRCDHVFSNLAYRSPQLITMSEASKIAQIFLDIIEDRDKYLYSTLINMRCDEISSAVHRANCSEETFRYHSKLASFFIFLGKMEEAVLALDVGKTKCLRARCKSANSHEMGKTWEMIKEERGRTRLGDISNQLKEHENNATVLVFHIDHYGILHCCVLNGEVKLFTFSRLDLDDLISQMQILLKPCNIEVRRDFSFFSDTRYESEVRVDSFLESLPHSNNSSTRALVRSRKPGNTTNASLPQTPLQLATLKLKELNAERAAKNLFTLLLLPLKDLIKGNKLIIIPDQYLFFLPFARLLDENNTSLSMNFRIQIVPTLHHLLSSFTNPTDSDSIGPAMFVGNPKLDLIYRDGKRYCMPLSPLPHATIEAKQLAAMFNTGAIIEDEATKSRVLKSLDQVSIFHVASHGDPMFGWIYLAPDFTLVGEPHWEEEEAYMLREGDLFVRQMKARLVFLSCCTTARGEVCREGVFGIARAFLTAGARSVIVTLWSIDDLITLEFANIFYNFLCEEKSVCEALQLTVIHFQTSDNAAYRSYTSWAPFQVFGDDVKFTKEEIEEIRRLGIPP